MFPNFIITFLASHGTSDTSGTQRSSRPSMLSRTSSTQAINPRSEVRERGRLEMRVSRKIKRPKSTLTGPVSSVLPFRPGRISRPRAAHHVDHLLGQYPVVDGRWVHPVQREEPTLRASLRSGGEEAGAGSV